MVPPLVELTQEDQQVFRKRLEQDGFVLVNDRALGIDQPHRGHIHRTFFNSNVLRRYPNDIPIDRERARDVVRYDWHGNEIELREHGTIAISGRGEHAGRREFDRIEVLSDAVLAHWIRGVLQIIPENSQQPKGTFGVNFFRTFTNVVTKPHQDGEEHIVVYVVDKIGCGAQTQLYGLHTDDMIFEQELHPGELIIFRDDRFRHNATPLQPPSPGTQTRRDALVCTVNYPDTYEL